MLQVVKLLTHQPAHQRGRPRTIFEDDGADLVLGDGAGIGAAFEGRLVFALQLAADGFELPAQHQAIGRAIGGVLFEELAYQFV